MKDPPSTCSKYSVIHIFEVVALAILHSARVFLIIASDGRVGSGKIQKMSFWQEKSTFSSLFVLFGYFTFSFPRSLCALDLQNERRRGGGGSRLQSKGPC